jgi:predicted O-methyltransferase YrrM
MMQEKPMEAILRLHEIYRTRGYTIRSGLQPRHFRHGSRGDPLAMSALFREGVKLSTGGGIGFAEMFFFAMLCPVVQPKKILVIGNAFGLSTILLSLLNPNAAVVAIDAGIEGGDNDEGTDLTRRIAIEEGLAVEVVRGFSPTDVPRTVERHLQGTLDLAFIDGMHTNDQQKADFDACWPYGGAACVYVLHDVLNFCLNESFASIVAAHQEMRGDLLWRTPSGMGALSPPRLVDKMKPILELFTQSQEVIAITERELAVDRYVGLPLVRYIPRVLPRSALRRLRPILYGSSKASGNGVV